MSSQRFEEERIDQREHRAVGADAQREYRDGDGREAGRFPEHPDAVAEIL
jgi:hypothetical protein